MSERPSADRDDAADAPDTDGGNAAPDAVKDPNAKTEGKPGLPDGGGSKGGESDPGGG